MQNTLLRVVCAIEEKTWEDLASDSIDTFYSNAFLIGLQKLVVEQAAKGGVKKFPAAVSYEC